MLISHLDEHEDAIDRPVQEFGKLDILVNDAALQMTRDSLEDTPDEEWLETFAINRNGMLFLTKAALPHLKPGSAL